MYLGTWVGLFGAAMAAATYTSATVKTLLLVTSTLNKRSLAALHVEEYCTSMSSRHGQRNQQPYVR